MWKIIKSILKKIKKKRNKPLDARVAVVVRELNRRGMYE